MTSKIIIRFLNARIPGAELKETNRSYKRPAFYLIKTASGQCYGGSTSSISKRLSRHTFDLRKGIHPIAELQKAYDAGIDITVDVTYAESRDHAFSIEQLFLDENFGKPGTLNRAKNAIHPGLGVSPTPENILAIKKAHTGKIVSAETREKIGLAHKGKTLTMETKAKLRLANLGKTKSESTLEKMRLVMKGKKLSKNHCEAISKGKKGKGFPKVAHAAAIAKMSKPIKIGDGYFSSIAAAAIAFGVSETAIRYRIRSNSPRFSHYVFIDKQPPLLPYTRIDNETFA